MARPRRISGGARLSTAPIATVYTLTIDILLIAIVEQYIPNTREEMFLRNYVHKFLSKQAYTTRCLLMAGALFGVAISIAFYLLGISAGNYRIPVVGMLVWSGICQLYLLRIKKQGQKFNSKSMLESLAANRVDKQQFRNYRVLIVMLSTLIVCAGYVLYGIFYFYLGKLV
jgi:hypothetical protein